MRLRRRYGSPMTVLPKPTMQPTSEKRALSSAPLATPAGETPSERVRSFSCLPCRRAARKVVGGAVMHFATRRSRRVNRYNGWRLEDAWLDKSTLTARAENGARRRTEGKGTVDDTTSSQSHGCRRNAARALRRTRCACPEIARRPQAVHYRQPGQHVDPRGDDRCGRAPDDGGDEQPRPVRSTRSAEQPLRHLARSGHRLGIGRRRH